MKRLWLVIELVERVLVQLKVILSVITVWTIEVSEGLVIDVIHIAAAVILDV